MAKQTLDAILELYPSPTMSAHISGEWLDSDWTQQSRAKAIIEIASFRFSDAKSLAKAKAADKKAAKREGDDDDEEPAGGEVSIGKKTGKVEEDYRFQITKQIEKATPALARAYFSNSYKPMRQEYNSFYEAKIIFRKLGAHREHATPFFTVTFRSVYVVGFELETQGVEPPTETIDFCFQTCEMSYREQARDGTLGTAKVKGWNFVAQKERQSQ